MQSFGGPSIISGGTAVCISGDCHHPLTKMLFSSDDIHADPEYILQRVGEEQIVFFYFGISVRPGEFFCSPLRADQVPTCQFTYHKGRLRFRDWAEPRSKDVFDMVGEKLGLSFNDTIQRIARDTKVKGLSPDPLILQERERRAEREAKYKGKSLIQVRFKPFSQADKDYLKSFGINGPIAKLFGVRAVSHVWIGGKIQYTYREHDPAFSYYFGESDGEQRLKIYFYKRGKATKGLPRFFCNTNRIQGWVQLPETGPFVVLTKSLKDVMSLYRLGVPSVAMQNETTEPYAGIVEKLAGRFGTLFSLYDEDPTGINMAFRLREAYGIEPLFIPKKYGSKDISDLIRDHGLDEASEVVSCAKSLYDL